MSSKDRARGLFREPAPLTVADRTTTEARRIIDEQTEKRQELTARLRAERLARDAGPAKARKK
ncbi:hypothetical protein GL279_12380 [Paracoccus limosus]|jgi:hypothetical protein|uniref:Uncharacterized protein n=1 Tax=Paracoccus limosus TaxID=913252 RepID=A0A844HA46_9RHOB|nr:hypothetical protein [Paracoccus limosus]MTH35398.1 hypothetical protein [Paracoccus limosus]